MKQKTTYNIKPIGDEKITSVSLDTYLITSVEELLGTTKLLGLINQLYRKNEPNVTGEFTMVRLISIDLIKLILEKTHLDVQKIETIYQYKLSKGKNK